MSDAIDCFVFQEIPFREQLFVCRPHFLLSFMMHHIMIIKLMAAVCDCIVVPGVIAATEANNLVASLRATVNLLVLSLLMD